jgi:two-component system phosphate regulon sensor histidine kinase PhoR
MINWPRRLQSASVTKPAIGVLGRNSFVEADSDFCTTLLAMAGHDLRQPLQVIVGAHDLLARLPHSDAARAQLTRAEDATSQLTDMLDRLVEVLRLHEFSTDNHLHRVPLGPMLAQLASEFSESARLKGIQLRVIPVTAVAFSHPILLSAMLRNLMRNAIDYTPHGGRVLVACRWRGSQVHIEIRDSGVGIPGDELDKVFRAFHRTNATRPMGLGLGLFIVKRTTEFLGHSVRVRSAVDRGSCFTLVASAVPPSSPPLPFDAEASG